MQKQNIEQIIRELFRENYRFYPDDYVGNPEAQKNAKIIGKGYWDNRSQTEIERDKNAGVTVQDYKNWCLAELEEQATTEE